MTNPLPQSQQGYQFNYQMIHQKKRRRLRQMVNQKLLNQPLLRLLRAELRRVERGRPPDVRLLEAKVPLVAHPADTLREEACQPEEVPLPKTSSVMRQ